MVINIGWRISALEFLACTDTLQAKHRVLRLRDDSFLVATPLRMTFCVGGSEARHYDDFNCLVFEQGGNDGGTRAGVPAPHLLSSWRSALRQELTFCIWNLGFAFGFAPDVDDGDGPEGDEIDAGD
jgi:hypothetical protein